MSGKNRTNPNKRPATWADVTRAKHAAVEEAVRYAKIIFFTILMDKYGWDKDELLRFWAFSEDLSDSIAAKRVSIADLADVLRKEYNLENV